MLSVAWLLMSARYCWICDAFAAKEIVNALDSMLRFLSVVLRELCCESLLIRRHIAHPITTQLLLAGLQTAAQVTAPACCADAEMVDAEPEDAKPSLRRQLIGPKPPPHVGSMLRGRLFLGVFDPLIAKPKLIKPVSALPALRSLSSIASNLTDKCERCVAGLIAP